MTSMIGTIRLHDDPNVGAVFVRWHHNLVSKKAHVRDPAGRAALRHAMSPLDVCLVEAFYGLRRALPDEDVERLALVASVLAHVEEHDKRASVARQLAADGKHPLIHPQRFQRFLQMGPTWTEQQRHATRLVKLLHGKVNVDDLARSLMDWNDPKVGENTRRRWALNYYDIVTKDA